MPRRKILGEESIPHLPLAACRDHPKPNLWHPRRPNAMIEYQARTICASCPERVPCAAYALAAHPIYGIWGGLTFEDREQILGFQSPKRKW